MHWHRPLSQLVRPVQRVPQAPQFSGSVVRLTQRSPQRVKGDGQRHMPPEHVVPEGHRAPHAPQFAGSVITAAQRPEQGSESAGHPPRPPPSPPPAEASSGMGMLPSPGGSQPDPAHSQRRASTLQT